jgi:hypothetical protein
MSSLLTLESNSADDFSAPIDPQSGSNGLVYCNFNQGAYSGYYCKLEDLETHKNLFVDTGLTAKVGVKFLWARRIRKWFVFKSTDPKHAEFRQLLNNAQNAAIFVCMFEQQAVTNENVEATQVSVDDRIQLLFQYIFAIHLLYTLFGVQAINNQVSIVKLQKEASLDCSVKRKGDQCDLFRLKASSYQLRFKDTLDLTQPSGPITYSSICDVLFPTTENNYQVTNNKDLVSCLQYLRKPGPRWDAQSLYSWGPCMMLFHPLFASYNQSLTPVAFTTLPNSNYYIDGYFQLPLRSGIDVPTWPTKEAVNKERLELETLCNGIITQRGDAPLTVTPTVTEESVTSSAQWLNIFREDMRTLIGIYNTTYEGTQANMWDGNAKDNLSNIFGKMQDNMRGDAIPGLENVTIPHFLKNGKVDEQYSMNAKTFISLSGYENFKSHLFLQLYSRGGLTRQANYKPFVR